MSSGWIKFEKDVRTDPRFLRMLKAFRAANVTQVRNSERGAVTLLVGCLVELWCYADTHIREDDTLDIGTDEVDELVGVEGFAALMPIDWLEVIDPNRIKLPGFQEHNGTKAKKRALTAKRVANHRIRNVTQERINDSVDSNAGALPDQTRLDHTRLEKNPTASATPTAGWFDDFKAIYPKRSGDQGWPKALRAAHARIAEGHKPEDFLSGARRYAAYCEATENTGSSYVKQAATFLGPDKPFLLEWQLPLTKSQIRQDANVAVSVAWLENSDAA